LPFPGERDGLPTKDDVADYLALYAKHFSLPIRNNTSIEKVEKTSSGFYIRTNNGDYLARQVVVATGPFHTPAIPEWEGEL